MTKFCQACLTFHSSIYYTANDEIEHFEVTLGMIFEEFTKIYLVGEYEQCYFCEECSDLLIKFWCFNQLCRKSQASLSDQETTISNEELVKEEKCIQYVIELAEAAVSNEPEATNHNEPFPLVLDFPCRLCFEVFGSKEDRRTHSIGVHRRGLGQGPFQCELCGSSLKKRDSLISHMKCKHLHRRFECRHCKKSFRSRSGMEGHEATSHNRIELLKCSLCHYTTYNKNLLRKHQLRHYISNNIHNCIHCNKNFVSNDNLKRHISGVHATSRDFVCSQFPTCQKKFKSKDAVYKHELIHKPYRYICFEKNCKKQFLTNQALRKHVHRVHPQLKLPPSGTYVALTLKSQFQNKNTLLEKNLLINQ